MEDEHETSALRHRRKKSSMSISACFHLRSGNGSGSHSDCFNISSSSAPSPNFRRSPSSWFKSTRQRCHELPDMIKPKRRNLMYRMGRHRRHASADFHYDPLSYALNFADDEAVAEVDHDQHHNFSSRLPVTPPRTRPVDDLAAKIDALELREKGGPVSTLRDAQARELKNNVFEVRTPRSKADPSGRSPRSPSKEGRRNVEVPSPRIAQEILVETC